jgi:nitrogen fixation protein FixH
MSATMERKSRWIPWVFVGGMVVVVVVNGFMAFYAISTFTGLTTGQAYDRGRAYNHVLQEAARQDALGWTAQVRLEGGRILFTITDRAGAAVPGMVEAHLLRPIEGTRVELGTSTPRKGFEAPALAPGQWEVRGHIVNGQGQRLDIRQRLIVP